VSKIQNPSDIRDTRAYPPLPPAPPGPPTEPLSTPPKFATGAAFYVLAPMKACCGEVFRGEECGCDELIAQYLSAPVIWMGRRT